MKFFLSFEMRDFIDAAAKMMLNERLPEFAAKTLEVSLRDLAESRARERIGNGGFGQELAEGIQTKTEGTAVTVDHKSNETNHLAEHVHKGGVIRAPPGRKYLAIPIDKSVKGERARVHRWSTPDGKPLFIRAKGEGPNGRAYLAEPRGKRGKPKILYVLCKETKPQKPRPWWPDDTDFLELTERELTWWLDRNMPKQV